MATDMVSDVGGGATDRVAVASRAITGHIRAKSLGPGDVLPSEADFGRALGLSRTVVREAFRSLAALRLIEIRPGRRARVAPLDIRALTPVIEHGVQTDQISIQQIYDARRTVETRTATLAALRRSDHQAEGIVALAEEMRGAFADLPRMMEADIALHRAVATAAGNPVFALIVGALDGVTRQTWPIGWRSRTAAAEQERMVALHLDLARAIEAGDPGAAADLMGQHFDHSVRALVAAGIA